MRPEEMTEVSLAGLFTGAPMHHNFANLAKTFRVREMAPSPEPCPFPAGASMALPETYTFDGSEKSSADFLRDTDTAALLVLQDGRVRHENYWLTGAREGHWISWSVAKSFVSALIGIAVEEGLIESIENPIDAYVPALKGSSYEGVRIKDVLQMSSGTRWNEDYSDPSSDIYRLGAAMGAEGSLDSFVQGCTRDAEPGTRCQYNSADTQALGYLLASVTGETLADYMHAKLTDPLGFEDPGYWLLDSEGREMAFGGVNLTARDFAKLGELYRLGGRWRGNQIVPETWVKASIAPDAPHLVPGKVLIAGHSLPLGYGYQWWIPDGSDGEFSGIGVYNQFVYVDPSRAVTVVKLSANRLYGTTPDEETNREMENLAFLRAVARAAA